MKRKILGLSLVIVLLFSLAAVMPVTAAEVEIEAGSSVDDAVSVNFGIDYVSELKTGDEIDNFKFTTVGEDAFYHIEIGCYTGPQKALVLQTKYEQELKKIFVGKDDTNFINLRLEPNTTYYLKVLPQGGAPGLYGDDFVGNYGFCVDYMIDDIGDNIESAKTISLNETLIATIDGRDDLDVIKFKTNEVSSYTITFSSNTGEDKEADIYDINELPVKNLDQRTFNGLPVGQETITNVELESNETYYIKIRTGTPVKWKRESGDGKYTLTIASTSAITDPPPTNKEEIIVIPQKCPPHNVYSERHSECTPRDDIHHIEKITDTEICEDCGNRTVTYEDSIVAYHNFRNNVCYECGYEREFEEETPQNTSAPTAYFEDVPKWHSNFDAINEMADLGLLYGYGDGSFNPDGNITRAEFAAVVCRALGVDESIIKTQTDTPFSDVPKNHWASGCINWAAGSGIVNGIGDYKFNPSGNIKFKDAVKMVVATLGYTPIADVNGGYPSGYMIVATNWDIIDGISGMSNDTLATRAVVSQMVYNALDLPIMKQTGFGSNTSYDFMDGEDGREHITLRDGINYK